MNSVSTLSRNIVRFGFYAFVTTVGLIILLGIKQIFFPLLTALLLSFLLEPIVNFFETRGLKRLTVVILIFIVFTTLTVVTSILVFPKILQQIQSFVSVAPQYKAVIRDNIVLLQDYLNQQFPNAQVPDLWVALSDKFGKASTIDINRGVAYLSGFFSLLSVAVIVPIVAFFFLVDGFSFQKAFLSLIPNSYFEMSLLLFYKISSAVKDFLRGQIIDASAVGILTAIGLTTIGLPYGLVIGLIAGVGNLIPYLGPVIGFIPAAFVIFGQGDVTLMSFIPTVIVFVLVQFVEGTFIYPIAVGKSVNLHPLIVMLGITVGGQVAGLLGMLLVIPLIAVVKVTLEVSYSYLKGYSII
jgi:putative permease